MILLFHSISIFTVIFGNAEYHLFFILYLENGIFRIVI